VRGNTWRRLTLEKNIGFKIAIRVGYIEVRRAGDAAGEGWANDRVIGRFRGHRCRWRGCEDVKVWRVGEHRKSAREGSNGDGEEKDGII
jgi:hypothetical protein